MWYVSQFQPGLHTTAPDARTSFSTISRQLLTELANAVGQDFDARLAAADAQALALHKQRMETQQYQQSPYIENMRIAMDFEAAGGFNGPKTAAYMCKHLHKLIQTWTAPGAKVVCLNDDTSEMFSFALPAVNQLVQEFLASQYQKLSQFELHAKHTNGCK
jgi:hypothetical protein